VLRGQPRCDRLRAKAVVRRRCAPHQRCLWCLCVCRAVQDEPDVWLQLQALLDNGQYRLCASVARHSWTTASTDCVRASPGPEPRAHTLLLCATITETPGLDARNSRHAPRTTHDSRSHGLLSRNQHADSQSPRALGPLGGSAAPFAAASSPTRAGAASCASQGCVALAGAFRALMPSMLLRVTRTSVECAVALMVVPCRFLASPTHLLRP
jgi:hypothetical protein